MGKPDCPLCEEMRTVVERAIHGTSFRLTEVDVREHPDLEKRYVFEIPVLLWDGREVARHRIGDDELKQRLATTSA